MYEEINRLTKPFQSRLGVIKDENGMILTESDKIAMRWKQYCEGMYTSKQLGDKPEEQILKTMEQDKSNALAPLRSEIEWAIKSLKNGKSPGCDNIYAEMIKASGDEGIDIYHKLCTKIWENQVWPTDWKRAIFIPLPKKGDLQICSNYRTIALISHASKILLKIIMERKLEEEVNMTQAGFRKNRGTRDHIFNLQMIIQKFREVDASLHTCFIDYSKAFDCVDHELLWQTLDDMNFDPILIDLIRSLYEGQQSAVQLECGTTEWFPISKGVRQGCILSPHLFSLYTEGIMREVANDARRDTYEEPVIQGLRITDLRYADDTALLSTTPEGLKSLITSVKEHGDKKGLHLNIKKTKIMEIDKCKKEAKIKINDEEIERVDSFEYLGARIDANGKTTPEIRRRLAIATTKLKKMEAIWKGQDTTTKMLVLKSTVFPIATYGCEAWTLNNTDMKRLTAFEMRCYRKILRLSWVEKVTNTAVLKKVGLREPILVKNIKRLKLSYFGHLKRHQTLEKHILEAKIEGKRRRGRPARRWEQDIEEWLDMKTTRAGRVAQERSVFLRKVREATSQGYAD